MFIVQLYFQSAEDTATKVHLFMSAIKPSVADEKVAEEVCASVHSYTDAPYFTKFPIE